MTEQHIDPSIFRQPFSITQDVNPQEPIQAYAKLQASDWTYFVQSLSIVIGRSSEGVQDNQGIDVDLGSHRKNVSRKHAKISFNFDSRGWELLVLGRNGLRCNNQFFKPSTDAIPIQSGTVIEIANVQFTFVLPPPTEQVDLVKPKKKPVKKKRKVEELEDAPVQIKKPRKSREDREIEALERSSTPRAHKPKVRILDLIVEAIESTKYRRLGLPEIYEYFIANYPYYRDAPKETWQDSVRHTLSGSRAFVKFPKRDVDGPEAKGNYWMMAGEPIIPNEDFPIKPIDQQLKDENRLENADVQAQAHSYVSTNSLSHYLNDGNSLQDLMPQLTQMTTVVSKVRRDAVERWRWEAWRLEIPPDDITLRYFPIEFWELGRSDKALGMTCNLLETKFDLIGRKERAPTKHGVKKEKEDDEKDEPEEVKVEQDLWVDSPEPLASKVWHQGKFNKSYFKTYGEMTGRLQEDVLQGPMTTKLTKASPGGKRGGKK